MWASYRSGIEQHFAATLTPQEVKTMRDAFTRIERTLRAAPSTPAEEA